MHLHSIRKILHHCYKRQEDIGPESAFRFSLITGRKREPVNATYGQVKSPSPSPNRIPADSKGKGRENIATPDVLSCYPQSDPPGPLNTATSHANTPSPFDDDDSNEDYLQFSCWPTQPLDKELSVIPAANPSQSQSTRIEVGNIPETSVRVGGLLMTKGPSRVKACPRALPSYTRPIPESMAYQPEEMTLGIAVLETEPDTDLTESGSSTENEEQLDIHNTPIDEEDEIAQDPEAASERSNPSVPSTPPLTAKRTASHISPVSPRRTRSKQKRRIITNDILAAMAAEKIMVGPKRTRKI